jgi:transglutaminase-like putative cysteine protease
MFLLLQITAARLVATDWAPDLFWTESLAGLGTLLGLALGFSRFRRGAVLTLAFGYTLTIVPWQLTRSVTDHDLADRLNRVAWILYTSFNQFANQLPVKNSLFFLSFVCLAYWLMGLMAGYLLARHGRVLPSIAVAGAAILVVQAYANYQPGGSWWLALFVLTALLLAGRAHFLQQRATLARGRVFVSEDSGTNLLSGLFMMVTAVVLVAWWIPSSPGSMQRAAEVWNTYIEPMRERLSNAVTSLEGPYGTPGRNFYGSSLALGQNAAAGDEEVLNVVVLESPGLNMRYYWRGRVYNIYDGGLWAASTTARIPVTPTQDALGIPDASDRSHSLFLITSLFSSQSLMYGPSPAVAMNRSADVSAVRVGPDMYDAFSWEARPAMASGSTYEVQAQLRNPKVEELQTAGETYPDWVRQNFLGVPERYRDELESLAEEISAVHETPYEKVVAITDYLRENIEYATTVPTAPERQDPILWVLMDYKKGFCNYYASAEVLLLRSIGIPARLAVGFARGELDDGMYTVFRRDAHAWPEVYFPGIGWVEFEPTASEPPLVRPTTIEAGGDNPFEPQPRSHLEDETSRVPEDIQLAPPATPLPFRLTPAGRALFALLPVLAALAALTLGYRLQVMNRIPGFLARAFDAGGGPAPTWVRSWNQWNQLEPIERAFAAIGLTLRMMGKPQPVNATPAAQARALARILPSARAPVAVLHAELETGLFTPRQADLGRARRAALAVLWRGLRTRVDRMIASLDGRAVYSDDEQEIPQRGFK